MVRLRISFDSSFFFCYLCTVILFSVYLRSGWRSGSFASFLFHVSVRCHTSVVSEDIEECASWPEVAFGRYHCNILSSPLRLLYKVVYAIAVDEVAVAASEPVINSLWEIHCIRPYSLSSAMIFHAIPFTSCRQTITKYCICPLSPHVSRCLGYLCLYLITKSLLQHVLCAQQCIFQRSSISLQ